MFQYCTDQAKVLLNIHLQVCHAILSETIIAPDYRQESVLVRNSAAVERISL